MSARRLISFRSTVTGRWQIPLLVLAAGLLGFSLYRIAAAHESLSVEDHFQRVKVLRSAGALTRAHAYLSFLLQDVDRPEEEKAELHRLLMGTIHQAEDGLQRHRPENIQAIIQNFRMAVRDGATPDAGDWLSLGDAYRWKGLWADAMDAFRQSLRLHPSRPDRIHRRLIEMRAEQGLPISSEVLSDLDAILEESGSTPADYRWALEQKIAWFLTHNEIPSALALVQEGQARLAGTAEQMALTYLQALCLRASDQNDQAETILRSLLNSWSAHDALWGKAGWLLARLQQEDERPQAAISFYETVLTSFPTGPLHLACELGRAESLAKLERYERSLEMFEGLSRQILARDRSRHAPGEVVEADAGLAASYRPMFVDRNAMRSLITTIGERRLKSGDRSLGVRFLQLALTLTEASDGELRAHYLSRIAVGFEEMARQTVAQGASVQGKKGAEHDDSTQDTSAQTFYQQAAEINLKLAALRTSDEQGAAESLERAADDFDAAGQTERVIEVLSQLVDTHPSYPRRAEALFRLGQGYQAQRNYPSAIQAYRQLEREYARMPAALDGLVPLAESLMRSGPENVRLGVQRLVDLVDDRGPDPLFNPQAREYRQALIRLAEFYSRTSEKEIAGHFEKAITRLEDAIALYPDDPEMPRLKFLLAEAYRQSAQKISESQGASDVGTVKNEVNLRLRRALQKYSDVQSMLAAHDAESLTDLEQTYLRASYSYIGDCLFDLGLYPRAIEAYRETAWRYENEPIAVSATMQVVHSYRRLGQVEESRAALARLQWLLKKLPATSFDSQRGMSPKSFWEGLVKRMEQTGIN